jgi:ribosome modulation factor
MNQRNQPQQKEPSQMAIEIYADLEEVAAEVAEVEVTAEVDAVDPIESEPTDAPEASNQEGETAEAPAEVETPTAAIQSTWTRTTDETDILAKIYNAEFDCARAEAIVEERKAELKEAKDHYDGCVEKLRELARHARNDSPANRPLFSNLEAKVETAEGAAREEEIATPAEPAWKSLTVDALPDITPKTKEQLRDCGINTLSELAELITRCEHDSTAAWPKGIGKVKQEMIVAALVTVQDLERCEGNEGVKVEPIGETVYPTAEEWEAMNDKKQIEWLEERAWALSESNVATAELVKNENWKQGFDAHDEGLKVANCPYDPGQTCDKWLCGWLRAKEVSERDAEE